MLHRADGSSIVQHFDGTRCTVATLHSCCTIFIESPGYANVTIDVTNSTSNVDVSNDIAINCNTDGRYTVTKNQTRLTCETDGQVLYCNGPNQCLLNHNGKDDLMMVKGDNSLRINCFGTGFYVPNSEVTKMLSAAFQPRYFIVDSHGQCAELLTVESLEEAKNKTDINTFVEKEKSALSTAVTLMEPQIGKTLQGYTLQNILPPGLSLNDPCYCSSKLKNKNEIKKQRLGADLGKGFNISLRDPVLCTDCSGGKKVCVKSIHYKQYNHCQPVDIIIKKKVLAVIDKWLNASRSECKSTENNAISAQLFSKKDQLELTTLYKQACSFKSVINPPLLRSPLQVLKRSSPKDVAYKKDLLSSLRKCESPPFSIVYPVLSNNDESIKNRPTAEINSYEPNCLKENHLCQRSAVKEPKVICVAFHAIQDYIL